jgi:hypothetical protein
MLPVVADTAACRISLDKPVGQADPRSVRPGDNCSAARERYRRLASRDLAGTGRSFSLAATSVSTAAARRSPAHPIIPHTLAKEKVPKAIVPRASAGQADNGAATSDLLCPTEIDTPLRASTTLRRTTMDRTRFRLALKPDVASQRTGADTDGQGNACFAPAERQRGTACRYP